MTLVKIDQLFVSYFDKQGLYEAVKGVSFSLGYQEILAIIGESGCGKTSLIGAFLPPNSRREKQISGEILYKNKLLWKEVFPSIAFIFQDPLLALNPTIKIGKQILESLLSHQKLSSQQAKKEALSLMEEVSLLDVHNLFDCYPHELSRGILQRITIAMALAQKADLIIADEPTTALDIFTAHQILALLQKLQKKIGFSLILISHHLSLVYEMSERTLVMQEGRIVEDRKTKELFSTPRHLATQKLIASAQFFSHIEAGVL